MKTIISTLQRLLYWLNSVKYRKASGSETAIVKGSYASSLLNNPAFDIVFTAIETDLIRAFKTSAPKDSVLREHLYYRMEGLAHIKAALLGMIANAEYEAKVKESKNKKKAA